MSGDGGEASPDLSRPTARALAWLLRNPGQWPESFAPDAWDYETHATCACGLARAVWPKVFPRVPLNHEMLAAMPELGPRGWAVFTGLGEWDHETQCQIPVSPGEVADAIDRACQPPAPLP